jgi:hypothetical protein
MSDNGIANVWGRLLKSFTPGEMTVGEWCDRQGVSKNQYFYWRRRLAAADAERSQSQRFVPVNIVDTTPTSTTTSGLTVHIAGAAIELQSGFDPALLRAVVQALGAPSC